MGCSMVSSSWLYFQLRDLLNVSKISSCCTRGWTYLTLLHAAVLSAVRLALMLNEGDFSAFGINTVGRPGTILPFSSAKLPIVLLPRL